MIQTQTKSTTPAIQYLLTFVKLAGLQSGSAPGFAHALKLSYNTLNHSGFNDDDPKTLTYSYRFGSHGYLPKPTLGIYSALMDELSTCALFHAGRPAAPGASVQFQTELLDMNFQDVKEVNVVNTVIKLGRNVSHSRTNFVCAMSGKTLAFSSHIKYMPTGSWVTDKVFGSRWLWDLWAAATNKVNTKYPAKDLMNDVIGTHLDLTNVISTGNTINTTTGVGSRATFRCDEEHTNPFGSMHGGCAALVMERVGSVYAASELDCEAVLLRAIQIEFLGAARREVLDVECETIGKTTTEKGEGGDMLYIRVLIRRGERIMSEGKLRFSRDLRVST